MTVVQIYFSRVGSVYTGLDGDTRPSSGIGLVAGAIYIVTDTDAIEHYDGATWTNVVAGAAVVDYQEFTGSGTWTKPANVSSVIVEAWGAGGGGGGGEGHATGIQRSGGAAGGGGSHVRKIYDAAQLGATETITIGAGGLSGPGGVDADGTDGGVGVNTTFGSFITAYGGGGGQRGFTASGRGGTGGGTAGAGATASAASRGGDPQMVDATGTDDALGGAGAGVGGAGDGHHAEDGGAGGAGSGAASTFRGGSSLNGGAGGGGGGPVTSGDAEVAGREGGNGNFYAVGGGGSGGGVGGVAGTNGADSVGQKGGAGGGGGGGNNTGTGGAGGTGGQPGGGGGGGAGGTNVGGAGGVGGAGIVRVFSY